MEDSEFSAEDIDEIVLVGGSTRVPAVRRTIGQYFGLFIANYVLGLTNETVGPTPNLFLFF